MGRVILVLLVAFVSSCGSDDGGNGSKQDLLSPELNETAGDPDVAGDTNDGDLLDSRPDDNHPGDVVEDSLDDGLDASGPDSDAFTPTGEVRLLQITSADQGTGGPAARAMAGDYVLENERVRFVIQGPNISRTWVPYVGSLIDADVVRPDGEPGRDVLNEVSPIAGLVRGFQAESFEIVRDGSDNHSALLRVTGRDLGIPVLDFVLPTMPANAPFTMEYELVAGSNALKISMSYTNPATTKKRIFMGDGIVWNRESRVLTPGFGWGSQSIKAGSKLWQQYAVATSIAYGFMADQGQLDSPISDAEITPFMGLDEQVKQNQTVTYTRWFIVGENLEEVRKTIAQKRSATTFNVNVNIALEDDADNLEPVDIVILDAQDLPMAHAWYPASNTSFQLEPGSYSVISSQVGRPDSAPVSFVVADKPLELELTVPATGRISYAVSGDDYMYQERDRIPARISLQAGHDAPITAPVVRREFTATGEGIFLIEPGDYTIIASRGYEYEYVAKNITVESGKTVTFEATLDRTVDTTGWVNGDLHIHSALSIDAIVVPMQRAIEMAAVGLERGPNTDHDYVGSLDQQVIDTGLEEWIRLTAGCEISPPGYHTNGYPMTLKPEHNLYFDAKWHKGYDEKGKFKGGMTNPEIWAFLRSEFDTGIVQINHPRGGQGYFDLIKYDPTLGTEAIAPGLFDANFDAVEIVNSGAVEIARQKVIYDYFGLQNEGIAVAAVGVSDSHTHGDPGDCRTYLRTGADEPRNIDDALLVQTIKAKRTVCASGPFIRIRMGDAEIGDTHVGDGEQMLEVEVQAPSWMPVDWVRVIVNGYQIAELPVEGNAPGSRLAEQVVIPTQQSDYWVLVYAGSDTKTLAPVSPQQKVFSFTSPIYVDRLGDGWEAPGLGAESRVSTIR